MTKNNLYSGFANYKDYYTQWWKESFKKLEKIQIDFLKSNPHPKNYHWPKDALHNFIRSWEYPFVYSNIFDLLRNRKKIKILDVGSGVTFFPYSLSELGFSVIALDNDPKTKIGLNKSNQAMSKKYGELEILIADAKKIPLKKESFDLVYSISVLEHIPNNHLVIKELARILKRNGFCILTFDINLNKNDIGVDSDGFKKLKENIDKYFIPYGQTRLTHPFDIISTKNSKYPLKRERKLIRYLKNIKRKLFGKNIINNYDLTSMGLVLKKK